MAAHGSNQHGSLAASAYSPKDAEVRRHLHTILDLIPRGQVVPGARLKEVFLAYLPTGGRIPAREVLYFETRRLDLDTDGKTDSWGGVDVERDKHGKSTHQGNTSLDKRAHNHKIDSERTDSNVIPYFVLPLRDRHTNSVWVGLDHGINLGDVGVIIGCGRVVSAQFADVGPSEKLGEASLAVHRAFGQNDLAGRRRVNDTDLGGPFVTIVFPGSGPPGLRLKPEQIATRSRDLFMKLGGIP